MIRGSRFSPAGVRFWEPNGSGTGSLRPQEGASGMTAVDIADIDAALSKVRAFIALLDQNHATWQKTGVYADPTPQQTETDNQIQEQLPFIIRIAGRADAGLPA